MQRRQSNDQIVKNRNPSNNAHINSYIEERGWDGLVSRSSATRTYGLLTAAVVDVVKFREDNERTK